MNDLLAPSEATRAYRAWSECPEGISADLLRFPITVAQLVAQYEALVRGINNYRLANRRLQSEKQDLIAKMSDLYDKLERLAPPSSE